MRYLLILLLSLSLCGFCESQRLSWPKRKHIDSSEIIHKLLIGTWVNIKEPSEVYIFSSDSLQEIWQTLDTGYLPTIAKYSIIRRNYSIHNGEDSSYAVDDHFWGVYREIYTLSNDTLRIDGIADGIDSKAPLLAFKKSTNDFHFILKSRRR